MRWTRRILVAAGTAIIAYAVYGAIHDPDTAPAGQLAFLAAVVIAHDALLMALTIGSGILIGRLLPVPIRKPVRAAAIISLTLTLMALPLVLGRGRRPDDPSALPLNYTRGLLIILALVWAIALATAWRTKTRRPNHADTEA